MVKSHKYLLTTVITNKKDAYLDHFCFLNAKKHETNANNDKNVLFYYEVFCVTQVKRGQNKDILDRSM